MSGGRFYARSYPEFWTGSTGRALARLSPVVRDLAHYLYAGPNVAPYGLYLKPLPVIVSEFGRAEKDVRSSLEALGELRYAFFDEPTGFVWVPEMAAYQLKPLPLKRADYNVKAARRWYAAVARNPFLGEFYDRYAVDLRLSDPTVWPGTEVERREWVASQVPAAAAAPAIERRVTSPVARETESDFETWWRHYPKKTGKIAARGEWMKLKPTKETPLDAMIATLQVQCRSQDWLEKDGQFIPDPERYLKKGKWLDEPRLRRAPLARQNEGTFNALMDIEAEDATVRPADLPKRIGEGRHRH